MTEQIPPSLLIDENAPGDEYYNSEAEARAGVDARPRALVEYLSSLAFTSTSWSWAGRIAQSEGVHEKVRDHITDPESLLAWNIGAKISDKRFPQPKGIAERIIHQIRRLIADLKNPPRLKDREDKETIPGLEIISLVHRVPEGSTCGPTDITLKYIAHTFTLEGLPGEILMHWGKLRTAAGHSGIYLPNDRSLNFSWAKMMEKAQPLKKTLIVSSAESLESAIIEQICVLLVTGTQCADPVELDKGHIYIRTDAFDKPEYYYVIPGNLYHALTQYFAREDPDRDMVATAVRRLGGETIRARFLEKPNYRPRVYKFVAHTIHTYYNNDDSTTEASSGDTGAGGPVAQPTQTSDIVWPSGDGQDAGMS